MGACYCPAWNAGSTAIKCIRTASFILTWVLLGIGLEFVHQLLAREERILATVRQPFAEHASALWGEAGNDHGRCQMFICDILSEASIENFVAGLQLIPNLKIDYVVMNTGVLRYPNVSMQSGYILVLPVQHKIPLLTRNLNSGRRKCTFFPSNLAR